MRGPVIKTFDRIGFVIEEDDSLTILTRDRDGYFEEEEWLSYSEAMVLMRWLSDRYEDFHH